MRSTTWSVNNSRTQAEKEISIVKVGYLPILIFDRQSPLLRSLQGNQWNRPGAFYNLQFCDQQTCSQDTILRPTNLFSRQKTPHSSLLNHPALVFAVRRPAIDLPSHDTTLAKNEEYQGIKTIFLIFMQPCRQQYREYSSPDAQLPGQGRS